jgi:hypothetical protein
VGYGSGADALLFEATERVRDLDRTRGAAAQVAAGRALLHYGRFLRFRRLVETEPVRAFTGLPVMEREERERTRRPRTASRTLLVERAAEPRKSPMRGLLQPCGASQDNAGWERAQQCEKAPTGCLTVGGIGLVLSPPEPALGGCGARSGGLRTVRPLCYGRAPNTTGGIP